MHGTMDVYLFTCNGGEILRTSMYRIFHIRKDNAFKCPWVGVSVYVNDGYTDILIQELVRTSLLTSARTILIRLLYLYFQLIEVYICIRFWINVRLRNHIQKVHAFSPAQPMPRMTPKP